MSGKVREIVLDGPVGAEVSMDGRRFLYFGGTNYLGMAGRPELRDGAISAVEDYGVSSSAARSSSGTLSIHLELEKHVAAFAGTETAVNYSSGYIGMAVLLSGLLDSTDIVAVHHDAHSSIREAVRAWAPDYIEFDIEDPGTLADKLKAAKGSGRVVVAGEGVSPLFGRVFPLPEVVEALDGREYLVMIDDAHGFGVLGERGRGTVSHFNMTSDNIFTCATLSKAFGAFSGVVPCSVAGAERIRNQSMAYQCSSPPPAPICGAAIASFEYIASHPELFETLEANNRLMRKTIASLGLEVRDLPTPIVPLFKAGSLPLNELSERLYERGILAPYTRYPGSPEGGMIRLAVTAGHSREQIVRLGEEIGRLL